MVSIERDDGDMCVFSNINDAWNMILTDLGTDEMQISVIQVFSERWVLGKDLFHWYRFNGTDRKTYNQLESKLKKLKTQDHNLFIERGRGEIILFANPLDMLSLIINDFLSGDPYIHLIRYGMMELHRYIGSYWHGKNGRLYSYIDLCHIIK